MNDPGKIQDFKLDELFSELIIRKHIISLYVVGTGYERLTCVVGTEQGIEGKHLLIDNPDGFAEAVGKAEAWNIRFNFIGPDQLEYIFSTRGGCFSNSSLRIPFPEFVERLQRRRDFRVSTLPGTKMVFVFNNMKGVIDLINVSLGGAYGVLMKHNCKGHKGPLFAMDQQLYKIGIIFPADKETAEQVIIINKAAVRRVENDKERQIYKYAFEFLDVDRDQKQKLTQAIYHIQRYFLKNR